MPGSSLWLLPPADHPLNTVLSTLIDKTSKQHNSPHRFLPHVTLTSDISPLSYGSDAQAWLDSLDLATKEPIEVKFQDVDSENVFVRKLYIKCLKTNGLKELAQKCRKHVQGFGEEEKAGLWAEGNYMPHLSLLYHDCPKVGAGGLAAVRGFSDDVGITMVGEGKMSGWLGGKVVLVPTDQQIHQWQRIAEKAM